jgi:hypothetical protein
MSRPPARARQRRPRRNTRLQEREIPRVPADWYVIVEPAYQSDFAASREAAGLSLVDRLDSREDLTTPAT